MTITHRGSDEGSSPPTSGSEDSRAPKPILGEVISLLDRKLDEARELDLSGKLAPLLEEILDLMPPGPNGPRIPDLYTSQLEELEDVGRSEIMRRIDSGEYPAAYREHGKTGRWRVPFPATLHREAHHQTPPSSNSGEPPLRDIPTYTE